MTTPSSEPGLTLLGKLTVAAVLAACAYGAWYYFRGAPSLGRLTGTNTATSTASPATASPSGAVQIGIAYGTEKQRWLESAVEQFAQTSQGRGIKVNLIPMGSIEAAQALERGDERIH